MAEDIIRVLRILEYTGPRSAVEAQMQMIQRNGTPLNGERYFETSVPGPGPRCYLGTVTMKSAIIGTLPEILQRGVDIHAQDRTEPNQGPDEDGTPR